MIVVTVPAYNESKNLRKCVESLLKISPQLGDDFRIVIAEDGSTDGTDIIAQSLELMYPQVIHLHSPQKLGKGLALKQAFSKLEGDTYAFVDCDLATDMKYFPQLINSIREGNDLASGSRYMDRAEVHRTVLRQFASRVYNKVVRIMFKHNVCDYQIGFKAFSKRLIKDVLDECESTGWFWDTEIIIRSINKNYSLVTFPVEWTERKSIKSLKMITNMSIENLIGLIRLRISI